LPWLQGTYYQAECTMIDAEKQVLHCRVNKCHVSSQAGLPAFRRLAALLSVALISLLVLPLRPVYTSG
jgi:hypothetical protein